MVDCHGEAVDECLAGIVERHIRARKVGGDGRNVQNATRSALHHVIGIEMGHVHEGDAVDTHECTLFAIGNVNVAAEVAKAGIVDQNIDLDAELFGLVEDMLCSLILGEVLHNRRDLAVIFLLEIRFDLVQLFLVDIDEDHIKAILSEDIGIGEAHAGGSSGDQCNFTHFLNLLIYSS